MRPYNVLLAVVAAAVLATIPVIILVLVMQKQFLRGLTAGAFKG